MNSIKFLGLASAVLAAGVNAQSANPYDGAWEVKVSYPQNVLVADLVVSGESGSFRSHAAGKNNPCGGRDTPVVVKSSSDTELKFTIDYEQVMPGCGRMPVTMTKTEDGALKGIFHDARWGNLDMVAKRK